MTNEPFVLSPKQHEFVYSLTQMTAMFCGRAFGKSTAGAYLVGNRVTHGQSGLVVAPTYSMLANSMIKMTLDTLRNHGYKKGKHFDYNKSEHNLYMYDKDGEVDAVIYFRSAENCEMIRSVTDCHFLLIDEAALITVNALEISMACIRGKTVHNPQYFFISTPRGRANWMADVFLDKDTHSIKATSYDNPNISRKSIDALVKRYGEDFKRQEIYAEILDSTSAGLFKNDDIDKLKTEDFIHIKSSVVFGIDVAGQGSDYTCISVRDGNVIRDIQKMHTPDDKALIGFVSLMVSKHPDVTKMNIDQTGLGAFVTSRLQPLHPNVEIIGVNFGSRGSKGYRNKRTQLYFNMRDRIRGNNGLYISKDIPHDITEEFVVELFATEYSIDQNTDFKLKPKEDIRKAISRSPDIADSVGLSCLDTSSISQDKLRESSKKFRKQAKAFPNHSQTQSSNKLFRR